MYNIKERIYMVTLMEVTYMKTKRISGFQWALTIFVFFVVTMALSLILRDFQASIGIKRFVFSINNLAPFIAAIICIIAFKNKRTQLAGLNFSIDIRVIERIILALILPLIIFIIGMMSFNRFADSFILLQANDLSVSVFTIIVGHIFMAFFAEFGFRSYLQNIVESKVNTFFASIIVGLMYAIWTINTTYNLEYTGYNFLYTFAFSMIVGELIHDTNGRTIYIATAFHGLMTFIPVFLFSEETGDLFSMKVIALTTAAVAIVYIIFTMIIRYFIYRTTDQSLDEVDPNNYLDHIGDDDTEETATVTTPSEDSEKGTTSSEMKNDIEQTPTSTPTSENQSEANYQPEQHEADNNLETATEVQETPSEQTADSDNTKPEQHNNDTDSKYNRQSSVVADAHQEIQDAQKASPTATDKEQDK